MKGYVVDCTTGTVEYVEDDTPFPPYPTPPTLYQVYKTITTSKGTTIKIPFSEPVELDSDEIAELEAQGYTVKELT